MYPKVDWTSRKSIEAYRDRIMHALEHADYLSPVSAYQAALWKCHKALAAMPENKDTREYSDANGPLFETERQLDLADRKDLGGR